MQKSSSYNTNYVGVKLEEKNSTEINKYAWQEVG